MTKKDEAQKEYSDVVAEGAALVAQHGDEGDGLSIVDYQKWYSRALKAVELLAPDRYEEFRRFYEPDPKRKEFGYGSYVIQDYVKGVAPSRMVYPNFDTQAQARRCLYNQLTLLIGVGSRADSVLSRFEEEVHAELNDAELESARGLVRINLRAAGALAGVVLEAYLGKVCAPHGIKFRKKAPTLSDYNDALKNAGVYGTPTWRKISYLADIRNVCSHKKDVDPTREQVTELIDGTAWATQRTSRSGGV